MAAGRDGRVRSTIYRPVRRSRFEPGAGSWSPSRDRCGGHGGNFGLVPPTFLVRRSESSGTSRARSHRVTRDARAPLSSLSLLRIGHCWCCAVQCASRPSHGYSGLVAIAIAMMTMAIPVAPRPIAVAVAVAFAFASVTIAVAIPIPIGVTAAVAVAVAVALPVAVAATLALDMALITALDTGFVTVIDTALRPLVTSLRSYLVKDHLVRPCCLLGCRRRSVRRRLRYPSERRIERPRRRSDAPLLLAIHHLDAHRPQRVTQSVRCGELARSLGGVPLIEQLIDP